jgi:hypothetical protein
MGRFLGAQASSLHLELQHFENAATCARQQGIPACKAGFIKAQGNALGYPISR